MVAFFLKIATYCAPEDSVKFYRIENANRQWLKQVLSLMKKQSRCGSIGNPVQGWYSNPKKLPSLPTTPALFLGSKAVSKAPDITPAFQALRWKETELEQRACIQELSFTTYPTTFCFNVISQNLSKATFLLVHLDEAVMNLGNLAPPCQNSEQDSSESYRECDSQTHPTQCLSLENPLIAGRICGQHLVHIQPRNKRRDVLWCPFLIPF